MDTNNYMCFTNGFPVDIAKRLYLKKHNQEPQRVFIEKGMLKLGPEPERKATPCAIETANTTRR